MRRGLFPFKGELERVFMGLLITLLMGLTAHAQDFEIVVGGNIYGGGNSGNVGGNTTVTVREGDIEGNVFGGARMANVGGRAFVNLDGEHATDDIVITSVYGGNDIAGTIGTSTVPRKTDDNITGLTEVIPEPTSEQLATITTETTDEKKREAWRTAYKTENPTKNDIDDSWNAFVRTSATPEVTSGTRLSLVVGSMFGGGNGDYDLVQPSNNNGNKYQIFRKGHASTDTPIAENETGFTPPTLDRTYLEILGGCIAHLYGGGNNATITNNTTICVNNDSPYLTETCVWPDPTSSTAQEELAALAQRMELTTFQSTLDNWDYNFARVFGGNNKAEMAIRPTWNLQKGKIRDLYSGGNQGAMTSSVGLLLEINPSGTDEDKEKLIIGNVYGGCRMADVHPLLSGTLKDEHLNESQSGDIQLYDANNNRLYHFPEGLPARVLVKGGHITNVYGGNDITGRVYGGNAVGINTTIYGNVYGGGNGSYAYTDNSTLGQSDVFKDFYYSYTKADRTGTETPTAEQTAAWDAEDVQSSITALNAYRPNAEQVSIHLIGTKEKPTIIHGSVYCGGNSATLKPNTTNHLVEVKFGSYVIADNVFLGNNGEHMIDKKILELYAGHVDSYGTVQKDNNGALTTTSGSDYSTLDLTDEAIFAEYMRGATLTMTPSVAFDDKNSDNHDENDYIDYTTYVGSFYGGGNIGSIDVEGKIPISFSRDLVIYNKVIGGCNNANIAASDLNAAFDGGVIGDPKTDSDPDNKVKIELNIDGLKLQPKRWNATYAAVGSGTLSEGKTYYTDILGSGEFVAEGTENGTNYFEKTALGTELIWNTISASTGKNVENIPSNAALTTTPDDLDRRLTGGNIYGGCYTSGHVEGDVVINLNASLIDFSGDHMVFDQFTEKTKDDGSAYKLYDYEKTTDYAITKRVSGVLLPAQGVDVLGSALSVFGGGKGKNTEIWGSTTINLIKGYTFQIFGGSEEGAIGKGIPVAVDYQAAAGEYVINGKKYTHDDKYSCTVNIKGSNSKPGVDGTRGSDSELAESEYIYGGGFEGLVAGNTRMNLGNGRIFSSFAGSCNADILGHTETYVGLNTSNDTDLGFPWIIDHIYGGNDLGGEVKGKADFADRITEDNEAEGIHVKSMVYNSDVTKASTYVEFLQGHVDNIFGGAFGEYDYDNDPIIKKTITEESQQPRLDNAFVNFKPRENADSYAEKIFGGSQGDAGQSGKDKMQNRSYVLIDIPQTLTVFQNTEVFGAGAFAGVGIDVDDLKPKIKDTQETDAAFAARAGIDYSQPAPDDYEERANRASAIIDLMRGRIKAAYGGSYAEGITRRTVVNVPEKSTINIEDIFGGAYGTQILPPCDVYESNVNYRNTSELARVTGAIYGGNNSERRTLYAKVNIFSPVWSDKDKGYLAQIYGAGRGLDTWSEYTEVNLEDGAQVYEVYGGGQLGHVLNGESVQTYMQMYKDQPSAQISTDDDEWSDNDRWNIVNNEKTTLKSEWVDAWKADWKTAWTIGDYYTSKGEYTRYVTNNAVNLNNNVLVRTAEIDDRDLSGLTPEAQARDNHKYNTNVIIKKGATVVNYAYGGGWGESKTPLSGDVYGNTYIALLGGIVKKDVYAAGTSGAVYNLFGAENFTASATSYIEGGSCRNVYGGGWEGSVGHHAGALSASPIDDVLGETHVVIGVRRDQSDANLLNILKRTLGEEATINDYGFHCGVPAIQRNAYGGGEGGAIYGTTHLTINNGYIGYEHFDNVPTTNTDLTYIKYGDDYYQEKIHDETFSDEKHPKGTPNFRLEDCGNAYGGGYDDNSNVDESVVTLYGGVLRNSLYGGGEIATIGRGSTKEEGAKRTLQAIYRPGKTFVDMYNGKVLHDVFGGGKGFNLLGYGHSSDRERLYTDGYVFGKTEVHIHGGEVGTKDGVKDGLGNVFGGGNIGFVYSPAIYNANTKRDDTNSTGSPDHYYYYEQDYKCTAAPTSDKYANKYQEGDIIDEITYKALALNEGIGSWEIQPKKLTETCKVVVSPYLQIKGNGTDVTYPTTDGKTYKPYDYVPTDYLNTLPKKTKTTTGNTTISSWGGGWENLVTEDTDGEERGILIHNAVFGGGNVSSNNEQTYANATTVFGNTTATLYDVYHRDFITVGTEHTGGLYGGGNLSMEDGYRELNITNYGTDYYGLEQTITLDQYRGLSNRERAYFKLKYQLKATTTFTKEGLPDKTYSMDNASQKLIEEEEYLKLVEQYGDQVVAAFTPYGECSIYAGRLLNTIQRADFCGVYGSRLVLQGAKDRVADVAVTDVYTLNRVGELSLNKQKSVVPGETDVKDGTNPKDEDYKDPENAVHGNYFGIYSVVNYLGNLTSDVHFKDTYRNGNGEEVWAWFDNDGNVVEDPTEEQKASLKYKKYTYFTYKSTKPTSNKRNNGKSSNQVALASGVFLELTTEYSTEEKKDYGYITGVIELDLINVKKDEVGGGFVYAKNEHRIPKFFQNKQNVLLSEYNMKENNEAVTYKRYIYSLADEEKQRQRQPDLGDGEKLGNNDPYTFMESQTSGNFIHHGKTIIDDCYPTNNAYIIGSDNYSPAHYWYVKGTVYIYDQTVSAYTGSANAYSKEVRLPLTITAASHGQLQLLNVKPNLYAYYTDKNGTKVKIGTMGTDNKPIDKVWVNNDADNYGLNDVITWWDWHQLTPAEREYFVTETYVNCVACKIDGNEYAAGEYVMNDVDYNTFKSINHNITDLKGEAFDTDFVVFRSSNNISHDTGYVLSFDMNSPKVWDDYYTKVDDKNQKISKAQYEEMLATADDAAKQAIYDTWVEGPTFTPVESGTYGKREFKEGAIITQNTFETTVKNNDNSDATFEAAYIAKESVTYTHSAPTETDPTATVQKTVNPGTAIPASEYNTEVKNAGLQAAFTSSTDLYVCTAAYSYTVGTGEEAQTINVAKGAVINKSDYDALTTYKDKYSSSPGAYVCIHAIGTTYKPGTVISKSTYDDLTVTDQKAFTDNCTMTCTKTVELEKGVYLVYGELKTLDEISAMKVKYPTLAAKIDEAMTPAYICSKGGEYGGQLYTAGTNYSAIQGWSSLSTSDRIADDGSYKFKYNYDALDLLTDKEYLVVDGIETPELKTTKDAFHSPYTDRVGVEYQAVFKKKDKDVPFTAGDDRTDANNKLKDGSVLTNTEFENLQNDQLHYTRIDVANANTKVYFATSNFTYKGVPYGKGQEIDEDVYLANTDATNSKVESVIIDNPGIQYYCYEDYDGGDKYDLLDKTAFDNLTNYQKYFVIQGKEPTERTTLYVSRESDFYDVLKEKVVTVVYQYTYYEEEDNGNIKQTNELHVVNVHLQLESGSPSVGLLNPPATVLPGWTVGMRAPDVSPGLYEVLENGWELFTTKDDADNHRNGIPFDSNTPVYWYQNGTNYIAFYSKTYLGKTYSPNYVPLSVANYHDLDEVMKDKEHHMYIDRTDVDRESKIYINNVTCKSDPDKSELDLFKDFFDLSLQTEVVTTEGAATKDHATLDSHVRGGKDLVFILNSDISPRKYSSTKYTTTNSETGEVTELDGLGWTSIGEGNDCFMGTFHGDGHTISGLTNSLFGKLCGDVFNLGVTGSFTGAGIAETGEGYVENCWVKTSATTAPENKVKAVYGNPERDGDERGDVQVVNCYYSADNENIFSNATDGTHGNAKMMPDKDFYNGTVAYDLNDFYLNKRYYHGINLSEDETNNYEYQYFDSKSTAEDKLTKGYYPLPSKRDAKYGDIGYVERRYADGDYRYAGGTIPETVDKRMRTETTTENNTETTVPVFYPIWPDDYLFFGQNLTYDYHGAHQAEPGHITASNRVYRAPAYFGNSTMSVVHFNPDAYLAAKSADGTKDAYPGMTAVDFKGHYEANAAYGTYGLGTQSDLFYPPVLDDDGLTSIANKGETRNLVVYAPSIEQNAKTYGVLSNYFKGVAINDYNEESDQFNDSKKYGRVAIAPTSSVFGHLVQSDLTATNDHLLVDKQDFNAPIAYEFDSDHLMWYQRDPENFVSIDWSDDATPKRSTKGWEGVSLPFKVDKVTTHQKGEITHFYEDNTTGHEYWLREFTGITDYDNTNNVITAAMESLKKESGNTKIYDNHFLWDYYYSENSQKDKNKDEYQTYYNESHTYVGYPSLVATKPYIIGFPSKQYYEFDLSGNWAPTNTAEDSKWNSTTEKAQTITFVSKKGVQIGKSDQDMNDGEVTNKGITFKPNYMKRTFAPGTETTYTLNNLGNSYDIIPAAGENVAAVTVDAFRPYFTGTYNASSPAPRRIIFSDPGKSSLEPDVTEHNDADGGLHISTGPSCIIVTSTLRSSATVRITTTTGIDVATYTIEPGQTVKTPVTMNGAYIVNRKKVMVR